MAVISIDWSIMKYSKKRLKNLCRRCRYKGWWLFCVNDCAEIFLNVLGNAVAQRAFLESLVVSFQHLLQFLRAVASIVRLEGVVVHFFCSLAINQVIERTAPVQVVSQLHYK